MTTKKCDRYDALFKDESSGIINNRADDERSKYRQMKHQAKLNINAQTEISQLKSDIDELKALIHQLIQK